MEGLDAASKSRPPSLRYLGRLKQPDLSSDEFELQESDVFWGPSSNDSEPEYSPRTPTSPAPNSHPVLFEGNPSLVRQRPAINPALSAISAARAIPHVQHSPPGSRNLSGSGPRATRMSAPVNVPAWPRGKEGSGSSHKPEQFGDLNDDDDNDYTGQKMVPPHEIVAQSHGTTAFSVFEGAGRTLKGRDLRRVRNAVFWKTGFLD